MGCCGYRSNGYGGRPMIDAAVGSVIVIDAMLLLVDGKVGFSSSTTAMRVLQSRSRAYNRLL